ncbi:MAG: LysM peptidoglycan-binding domain-containing protein [Opitutaceae bacterium]|jgi:nucleoid-associated protein YgaU|nr:LysM peptidoglycan-binding domain-containing protein [Opitutaceae bacterium]
MKSTHLLSVLVLALIVSLNARAEVGTVPSPAPAVTPAPIAPAPENSSDLAPRLNEAESKLEIALSSYGLLQKEFDALTENSNKAAAASLSEKNTLTAQVAVAESRIATAQAEATRANEALASLQRASAQYASDLATARALIRQLQGTNTIIVTENYQLKTRLAGIANSAVSLTPPATSPGEKSHLVVAGDSLARISQRYYGTANRWQDIYLANPDKIGLDGVLRLGTQLRIP